MMQPQPPFKATPSCHYELWSFGAQTLDTSWWVSDPAHSRPCHVTLDRSVHLLGLRCPPGTYLTDQEVKGDGRYLTFVQLAQSKFLKMWCATWWWWESEKCALCFQLLINFEDFQAKCPNCLHQHPAPYLWSLSSPAMLPKLALNL